VTAWQAQTLRELKDIAIRVGVPGVALGFVLYVVTLAGGKLHDSVLVPFVETFRDASRDTQESLKISAKAQERHADAEETQAKSMAVMAEQAEVQTEILRAMANDARAHKEAITEMNKALLELREAIKP